MLDAHLHLCDDQIYSQADLLIQEAAKLHIEQMLCVVTNADELQKALKIKSKYSFIKIAASTTPHEASDVVDPFFDHVKQAAENGNIDAIGETGLEYFHKGLDKALQKEYLSRYIELSLQTKLPLVFHCRDAFEDLFHVLSPYKGRIKGMIHCFTGTYEEAKKAIDLGLMISISGIVTFKNSHALQVCVSKLPLSSLLIETDAPYLAPLSKRGQINRPSYILETYQKVAYLKNISQQELMRHVVQNFHSIF